MSGLAIGLRQVRRSFLTGARPPLASPSLNSCSLCGRCQGGSSSLARLHSTSTDTSSEAREPLHPHRANISPATSQGSIQDRSSGQQASAGSASAPPGERPALRKGTSHGHTELGELDKRKSAERPSAPSQEDILKELQAWASTRAKLATRHFHLSGPQLSLLAHIVVATRQARTSRSRLLPADLVRLHDELLESAPDGQTCEPSGETFALMLRYAYRRGDGTTLQNLSYHATKWYQANARANVARRAASASAMPSQPSTSQASPSSLEGPSPEVDLLALIHNLGMAHRTRGGRRTLSIRMLRVRESALQGRRRQASLRNQDLQMRFAYQRMLNPRGIPVYREGKVAAPSEMTGGASPLAQAQGGQVSVASPFESEVISKSALARPRYSRLHTSRSKLKLMRQLERQEDSPLLSATDPAAGVSDDLLQRWKTRLEVRDRRRSMAESEVREMMARMRNEAGDSPIGVPTWLLLTALRRRAEQGAPTEAKALIAAYMASLRDTGRIEGKTLRNPARVFAVSRPDAPPAGASLLNLVLRAHLVAGHSIEAMLKTTEQMTGKIGFRQKVLNRVFGEDKASGKPAPQKSLSRGSTARSPSEPATGPSPTSETTSSSILPMDFDQKFDGSSFEYRVLPNETTILLLLAGVRLRRQRVPLGTSILRQAMYSWMPTGKGGTSASAASALASRPLEMTTATARTLLSWALRERKDSTKLARSVLSLHKRYRELEGRRSRSLARSKASSRPDALKPRRGGEASKWRRVLYRAMEAKVISRSHYLRIC